MLRNPRNLASLLILGLTLKRVVFDHSLRYLFYWLLVVVVGGEARVEEAQELAEP